jgi:ferrous iron transport protein B
MRDKTQINVLVAGGTNVGKTSVCFGLAKKKIYTASSSLSHFGVNKEEYTSKGVKFNLFETPGFNNLINTSEDELKTKEILLENKCDMILHVANARHILRSVLNAIQLIEFDLPVVMALNMMDEAEKFGNEINIESLSKQLDVAIFPTVANEGEGIDHLKKSLFSAKKSGLKIKYNHVIESSLENIKQAIEPEVKFSRGLGILILISDSFTLDKLGNILSHEKMESIKKITASIRGDVSLMVMNTKTRIAENILKFALEKEEVRKIRILEIIGKLSTNKLSGTLILGLVLIILYLFIGKLGAEYIVDFVDGVVFLEYINPFFIKLAKLIPSKFVQDALVGEYGMLSMGLRTALAVILPIIATFFFAFSFLEDLGYMPRLSVLLNRMFKKLGINGRAILPLILGFSCVTMATISTRVLEEKKERLITILMLVLVIPCSAKLSVIIAILAPVSIVGILIIVAVLFLLMFLMGSISSRIIPGVQSDFIMEIFPLKIPKMKAVLYKTYKRSLWFLDEALPFFIYGTFCLFLMDKLGILVFLEELFSPIIVDFLNLPIKFTEAYLLSFFRGEAGIIILRNIALSGQLSNIQVVVSVLVIILSIPCLTNLLVIIKEYGLAFGLFLVVLIMPTSIIVGGVINFVLRYLPITI